MSYLDQFFGTSLGRPPNALIGAVTGVRDCTNMETVVLGTLSGAMTAATYKNVLSVTGSGVLTFAGTKVEDGTARDIAIKATIDGTQAIELTASAVATAHRGLTPVGFYLYTASTPVFLFDQIPFNSSLVLAIRSSLTETDKMRWAALYRTTP